MNRKEFIKKSLLGVAAGVGLTLAGKAKEVKPYSAGSDIGTHKSNPVSDNPNDYLLITEDVFSVLLNLKYVARSGVKDRVNFISGVRVSLTKLHLIPDNVVIKGCYFDVWPSGGFTYNQSRQIPVIKGCYLHCPLRETRHREDTMMTLLVG